jgi:large subunit ribosomal protein L15
MLNTLSKTVTKRSKIVGRGIGSGKGGHTTGKGTKGHKSRSGYKNPRPGFEGGQMPLSRRIPKLRGFTRGYLKIKEAIQTVTTAELNKFDNDMTVDMAMLRERKMITYKAKGAKIVSKGELTKKLNLTGISVSSSVKSAIEKMGGTVK